MLVLTRHRGERILIVAAGEYLQELIIAQPLSLPSRDQPAEVMENGAKLCVRHVVNLPMKNRFPMDSSPRARFRRSIFRRGDPNHIFS